MSSHFQFDIGGSQPITVNVPNQAVLMDRIRRHFRNHDGFALATINLDHLVKLRTSERFREVYGAQDMVVADGNPIVWLSRMARHPVQLAPGSDLVIPLVRIAAEHGVPVALLGATKPVLKAAAERLCKEAPRLQVAACLAPSQNFDPEGAEADALLTELGCSGAGLTLLALGAPRQETFAARGRTVLPGMGFVSIGAGLDFLAGTQTRAPRWMRCMALEWLWRMLSNPTRLAGRYARCAMILPQLAVMALRQRGAARISGN